MGIHTATLSYQKDKGVTLNIQNRPLYALVAEHVGDEVYHLLVCVAPEWLYKVRWGKADEDGWTDRSLGSQAYRLGQWAAGGFGAWRKSAPVAEIPVTYAWVREHMPDVGWPWDGSDPDDEEAAEEETRELA